MKDNLPIPSLESIEKRFENLERVQRTDHDTLIRVETKMDSMTTTLTKLADGTTAQLINMEKRIVDLEKARDESIQQKVNEKVSDLWLWKRDAATAWKTIAFVAATISAVVTFLLSLATKLISF